MIEGESLPHTQMRVGVHVSLALLLTDFCTQVFHDGARLVVRGDTHDTSELAILPLLAGKRGTHSDHDLKVVISTPRRLRLKQWILRRGHWGQALSLYRVSHLERIASAK